MEIIKSKAVFLDRDGVINENIGYNADWSKFKYKPLIKNALKIFLKFDYKLIIITNQGGVARGIIKEKDVKSLHKKLIQDMYYSKIEILDVKVCFHHPLSIIKKYPSICDCRKPSPKMILDSIEKYNIDPSQSIMVGDNFSDIEAGKNAKINTNVGIYGDFFKKNQKYDFEVYNSLYDFALKTFL